MQQCMFDFCFVYQRLIAVIACQDRTYIEGGDVPITKAILQMDTHEEFQSPEQGCQRATNDPPQHSGGRM